MNWEAVSSSFVLVAASEMGDKTQLLALTLASRYRRPWSVMVGIVLAVVANHALASSLGAWVSNHVPARVMAAVLAVLFIGFGLWTLRREEESEESKPSRWGPVLATFLLFFLAEMGDKTQFAAMALGARFHSAASVTLGTTLAMTLCSGLAVFVGEKLASKLQGRWLRLVAASLFFIFGLASAFTAWRGL